jgi:hypothetical protein
MGTRGIPSPVNVRVGLNYTQFTSTTEALRAYFMENACKSHKPTRFSDLARDFDCSIAMPGIIYKKMVSNNEIPAYYEAFRVSGPKMTIRSVA